MKVTFKGRPVEVTIAYSGRSRDPVNIFADHAVYEDNGKELTDEEYEALNNQCYKDGSFYDEHCEQLIDDADIMADAWKDDYNNRSGG